jgi:nitroimidazol reductase NimA-like FMN-containing flavoprotein (pyridoxamine 5'-phosphate oxidase superfamily)
LSTLSKDEIKFLKSHTLGRLATASKDCIPQVTPVVYAVDKNEIIIAVDYGTKKLNNIRENPNVSLIVDTYRPNRGLMIQGKCKIHERGSNYLRLLHVLFDKFDFYRKNPWGEGESPILEITVSRTASWGI